MATRAKNALVWMGLAIAPVVYCQSAPPDAITGNAAPVYMGTLVTCYEQFGITNVGRPIKLRYQNLGAGSEMISLNNQGLAKGADYTIDYTGGVLYLIRQVSVGQILRVTYQHYSGATTSAPGPSVSSAAIFNKNFAPDIGLMPHLDSSSGNPLALDHSFTVGGFGSRGLALIGSAPLVQGAGFGYSLADFGDGGDRFTPMNSKLVVENLTSNVGHGKVSFDYQDISQNFADFGTVKSNGYSDAAVSQLEREAGLKRMGLAMQDVNVGGLKISDNFKTVSDGGGSVSWQNLDLSTGGLKLTYDARHIASGFTRFSDLAESDRDTLMKEAGLSRQTIGADYKGKFGEFSFASNAITDETGQRIRKRSLSLATSALTLDVGDQSVGQNFLNFTSLTDQEQKDWSNESGLNKKWLNLQTAPIGKGGQPVKLDAEQLKSQTGGYQSGDLSLGGKRWTLQLSDRKTIGTFGLTANLSDAQVDQDIKAIANMYAPTGIATGPNDRAGFLSGANIDRSAFRLTLQPLKDANLDIEAVKLVGSLDYANLQTIAASSKNFDFTMHKEHLGANFVEQPLLLGFEQQRLGNVMGTDKTDVTSNLKLDGSKRVTFNMMSTVTPQGDANRTNIEYVDKRIDLSYATRRVSPGFSAANGLPDPDAPLLSNLNGFKDRIFKGVWKPSAKLTIQGVWENEHNDSQGTDGYDHNVLATWDPNKTTHLTYTYFDSKSDNPMDLLFENRFSNLTFLKDFGKYGKLQFVHQDQGVVDPNNNPAPVLIGQQAPNPDPTLPQGNTSQNSITYTANLDKNTQVQTQQSETKFSDGTKEDMSANTISRALTKNFGLSYTDLHVAKPGPNADESKNNYGFWIDIAKGMRFSYGFVRDLNFSSGNPANTSNTTIGITPGTVGLLHVDSANYTTNTWDDVHNQVTSNFALKSSKPFRFGFIKDMQFNLGMDTSSDYSAYSKKNELANISGKIGANTFMVEYKSMIDPSGNVGSDRFLSFQTDQNPKKWIEASIKVKERSTPGNSVTMIRDYSITLRPLKNLELTNHVLTNPEEEFRPDVMMGSVTSPWRLNTYKLDYHTSKSTTIGATWEDRFNDSTQDYFRTAGLDVELFKDSGAPLTLWYGMESGGGLSTPHQYAQRFYFKYYRKPGPNQVLSLFLGNITYAYTNNTQFSRNNWSIHTDYEYRFW